MSLASLGRVRDTAYRLTIATGLPRYRRRRGAAIYAFHNVVADEGAGPRCDRSLHVPVSAFSAYVDVIARSHTVVPLAEIGERVRRRLSVDGLAAITFDDAYRGVLAFALPLLARRGLPSTLFVVSEAACAPAPFWWDLLGTGAEVPATMRETALDELRGDQRAVLERWAVPADGVPPALYPATWREVRAVARDGVSIGSHTVTHRNLAALDPAAAREELERSRAEIGAALGAPPSEIAYPYGLMTPAVVEAARDAGYAVGVSMRFARAARRDDPLALPRINVPAGISLPAFECWSAGIRLRRGA